MDESPAQCPFFSREGGAEPSLTDGQGKTPPDIAIERGHVAAWTPRDETVQRIREDRIGQIAAHVAALLLIVSVSIGNLLRSDHQHPSPQTIAIVQLRKTPRDDSTHTLVPAAHCRPATILSSSTAKPTL